MIVKVVTDNVSWVASAINEFGANLKIVTGIISIVGEMHRNNDSEQRTSDSFSPFISCTAAATSYFKNINTHLQECDYFPSWTGQ